MAKLFLSLLGFSLAAHGAVAVGMSRGEARSLLPVSSAEVTVDLLPPDPPAEPAAAVAPPVPRALTYAAHPRPVTAPRRDEQVAPVSPAPAVSALVAQGANLPRFSLVVGSADVGNGGAVSTAGVGQGSAKVTPTPSPDAQEDTGVSVPAYLLSSGRPEYPSEARAARVEADVPLEIVVDERGRVVESTLLRRAGHGFDESALRALQSYRFAPAQRAGVAVRVRMLWTVAFRLE